MLSQWYQIALNVHDYLLNSSRLLYVIFGHKCDIINLNVEEVFIFLAR